MSAPDTTEDEDEYLGHLLTIMNDESQPTEARLEAANAALPLCHSPIPAKHIEITGEDMSYAEWLREARAGNLSHQVD
jgi:hypothetical protein